jgi:hypothetical protein
MKKRGSIVNLFWLTIYLFLFTGELLAQTSWEQGLKNESGVVIQQNQQVEILINDEGNLEILDHVYEETQHFSDNASLYREQSLGYSSTFSEITDLEAYSLIPDERNKFKKIPVKDFVTTDSRSSGIFYDDQKKITYLFPALSAGSKTVISYTKKYNEPRLWGYYMFSSFFPVEKSIFSVKAPPEVKLKFSLFSIDNDNVKFTTEKKGKNIVYTWTADHLNRIELSKGADGVLHSAPHLIIHVDSYEFAGQKHNVLGDVNDLHTWYQNFLKGIDDDDNSAVKNMVDNIIAGKSTELEKVEAIYNWVQQNIKYIAIEDGLGGFRPRSSNTVFTRRYGDCKDMSNLIHSMLTLANIPSNLAWIGTTAIPYSHREVPTPMADNHMICTYVNSGRYYFLDATDPYNILGTPTSHIQGKDALVNKGSTDFELVNVPIVAAEKNYTMDSVFLRIEDNKVLGSGQAQYSGYKKMPIVNNLENLNDNDKKTFLTMLLTKGNNKFLLDSVTTQHVSDKNKDLLIDYNFSLSDYIWQSSDEIFVNPHLNKELENGLIDISHTNEDVFYPYKSQITNIYYLSIPADFKVNFLPENARYETEDFGFDISYLVVGDQIQIHQKIKINILQLKIDQFESWNTMIKGLFAAYKESIVLGRN